MGNIVDYMKWRGDITVDLAPLNTVDELVFSVLVYGIFEGIVSEGETQITIAEAARRYRELHPEVDASTYDILDTKTYGPYVLFAMAESKRFCDMKLSYYRDVFDEAESIQFAAITVETGRNARSIVFRGTDATIDGWREDFAISFSEVGAQKLAYDYLNETMTEDYRYHISGHSKGGNLAEYGAMECDDAKKDWIDIIYSFDGPGICPEMKNEAHYAMIAPKLLRVAPIFSVVGMLFRDSEPDVIANSVGQLLMQHAAFTWEIEGTDFKTAAHLTPVATNMNRIINEWIDDETMEERKAFTKGLFDAFKAGGAVDVQGVAAGGIEGIQKILKSLATLDKETKGVTMDLVKTAAVGLTEDVKKSGRQSVGMILANTGMWYAIISVLFGVFLLAFPDVAMIASGWLFLAQIIFFSVLRIVTLCVTDRKAVWKFVFYGVLTALAIAGIVNYSLLPLTSGVAIALGFGVMAGVRLYNAIHRRKIRKGNWLLYADAAMSMVLTIACFIMMVGPYFGAFIKVGGLYLVIMSMLELFREYVVRELKVYTR